MVENYISSDQRKGYLKIIIAIALLSVMAVGSVRLLTLSMGADATTFLGRVIEARAALPQIVKEEQDLVMVFGSSMVDAGFSPRIFDQKIKAMGKSAKSYNFGFGGLNPYFQDYLSLRIKESFNAENKKLKLAVIEFNPFQTTKTRWNGAVSLVDSFLTVLVSDEEMREIAMQDPERGALLYNIKYIRDNISSEMFSSFIGREMFPEPRAKRLDEPEGIREERSEIGKKLSEQFEKEFPDYVDSDWSYEWQGGGTIPSERSQETLDLFADYYKTFQNDANKKNRLLNRKERAGIETLHFEPILVESFINIVENFKQFSEQVEIVMLPRDHKWVKYSPEAQARLNKAVKQIEQATGITIKNHQRLDSISSDMFSDVTHLTRYSGQIVYTNHLADTFAHLLD